MKFTKQTGTKVMVFLIQHRYAVETGIRLLSLILLEVT